MNTGDASEVLFLYKQVRKLDMILHCDILLEALCSNVTIKDM